MSGKKAGLKNAATAANTEKVTTEEVYDVERILDERTSVIFKKTDYLLQWVGYPLEDSTWESADYVRSECPQLVEEWENELKNNKELWGQLAPGQAESSVLSTQNENQTTTTMNEETDIEMLDASDVPAAGGNENNISFMQDLVNLPDQTISANVKHMIDELCSRAGEGSRSNKELRKARQDLKLMQDDKEDLEDTLESYASAIHSIILEILGESVEKEQYPTKLKEAMAAVKGLKKFKEKALKLLK